MSPSWIAMTKISAAPSRDARIDLYSSREDRKQRSETFAKVVEREGSGLSNPMTATRTPATVLIVNGRRDSGRFAWLESIRSFEAHPTESTFAALPSIVFRGDL